MVEIWAKLLKSMTLIEKQEECERLLEEMSRAPGKSRVLSFLNVQGLMLAGQDEAFRNAIYESDFILRDGVGARLLCRVANISPGLNLNGTDFIPKLLAVFCRERTVAIMGTREPALSSARQRLLEEGFVHVRTIDGFQPNVSYLEYARRWKPGLIILAMGMPKQECVAALLKQQLSSESMLIVNGGAIIDYMGGSKKRAPAFMCKSGLEWLYRLLRNPRHMWRRNLLTVEFLCRIFFYRQRLLASVIKTDFP